MVLCTDTYLFASHVAFSGHQLIIHGVLVVVSASHNFPCWPHGGVMCVYSAAYLVDVKLKEMHARGEGGRVAGWLCCPTCDIIATRAHRCSDTTALGALQRCTITRCDLRLDTHTDPRTPPPTTSHPTLTYKKISCSSGRHRPTPSPPHPPTLGD